MDFEKFIPAMLKTGPAEILAAETDELMSRAAVCRRDSTGDFRITAYSESIATDPASAVADILRKLSPPGGRLPTQAILLSPQVQTAILKLPVNPQKPLPFKNMQELVRWELEPYMSKNSSRRIGAILVGRGYLGWEEVERLLGEIEQSAGKSGPGPHPWRLGELAVRDGLITEAQLEECLKLQQSAQDFAGEAVCGWSPLDEQPQDFNWKWLICGVTHAYRQHMVEIFRENGLRLRAIYPLVGCAGASLNGSLEKASAVFEYNSGYLNYARFSRKRIVNSRTVFTHESGNPLRSCRDLFENQADRIWLAGRWPDIDSAVRDLQDQLGKPCEPMPIPATPQPGTAGQVAEITGIKGAARHFLDRSAAGCVACVRAHDPMPPLLGNRWVQAAVASLTATAILIGLMFYFSSKAGRAAESLKACRTLSDKQAQVYSLQRRLADMEKSLDFTRKILPARQKLIPDLLAAIEESCPEEITIRRLAENTRGEIVLNGWGLSAQAIQAFKIDLQDRLLNLAVVDGAQPIRQERGWRTLNGYSFELRLLAHAPGAVRKGGP